MFTAIVQTLKNLCPAEEERFFFWTGWGLFFDCTLCF